MTIPKKVMKVSSYLKQGAQLISTNLDSSLPVSNKQLIVPDVGSLIKVVTECTKDTVKKFRAIFFS